MAGITCRLDEPRRVSVARTAGRTAVLAALLCSCSPAHPPESATSRGRFQWSMERYETGKYNDAIRGLRDLLFRDPLHPTADSARFVLAESYLRTGQELLAANEFQQLAVSRPNSPMADDAQFGTCRTYWKLSPDLPRDQENTRKTVEECTRLLEFFPRSPLVGEAREILAQAREKLAAKDLRTGRYYHKRRMYESAIIYLEGILRDYPDADVLPEVLYVLHDSYSQIGFQREADAVREHLLETYPESVEATKLARAGERGGS